VRFTIKPNGFDMTILFKKSIEKAFNNAGITLNGQNPWDIQVQNEVFYKHLWLHPELALGEAYVNGFWECQHLDEFFYKILRFDIENFINKKWLSWVHLLIRMRDMHSHLVNFQSKKRAFIVGQRHYDIGNDLYQCMLDKRMNYSCGYWANSTTLEEAQEAKLELICQKLQLQPGMEVLDIGCGWGAFSKYAAEKYGVSVTGITVSQEQQKLAQALCKNLPVKIILEDYRDLQGKFDRICSIGMFEHVGYKNYRTYMEMASRCLKDGGLFLLHTIGNNHTLELANPWIRKYIFPNGSIPSIRQIGKAMEGLFIMEDWHNFGNDYDKTLKAWHANFNAHWEQLKTQYSEKFCRMWNYYLLSCAGAFRARDIQLWQILLSKNGVIGGYRSVR
jgi:cyclopropane-fatty-acyl-phospholipid synthase